MGVMSRLLRETNPPFGERPAVLPQHQRASGIFVVTGENNPLPTANYTQNGNGIWVPVNQNNPLPTKLTGSFVEELPKPGNQRVRDIYSIAAGADRIFWTPTYSNRFVITEIIVASDVDCRLRLAEFDSDVNLRASWMDIQLQGGANSINIIPHYRYIELTATNRSVGFRNHSDQVVSIIFTMIGREE